MKLSFLYQRVDDLAESVAYYRDALGWEEAWREGTDTVAFWLPNRETQLMLSSTPQPAGPMFLVDSLADWLAEHSDLAIAVPAYDIPGGSVAGLQAPSGHVVYVFDQPDA